jgi:hypothetical protein
MHVTTQSTEAVQSFITSVSSPATSADVLTMLRKNSDRGRDLLDIDMLLRYRKRFDLNWSAPRWATVGDVVLFYCTKKAFTRCQALARQERQGMHDRRLAAVLERAMPIYERYAGTIFACGRVSDAAQLLRGDHGHFKGTIFAEIDEVRAFERPLRADEFAKYVHIGQRTITAIHGSDFAGLQHLLARRNTLPNFLAAARPGGISFRDVDAGNWQSISTQPDLRFIDESQLRVYLLDYLLAAMKDPRTPLLKECTCYRDGRATGRADYCIQVGGRWITVEAKLNVLAERDLLSQVGQYLAAERFKPTAGRRRDTIINAPTANICLVGDQSGIYVASAGRYIECRPGEPRWPRTQLNPTTAAEIRAWLRVHCG